MFTHMLGDEKVPFLVRRNLELHKCFTIHGYVGPRPDFGKAGMPRRSEIFTPAALRMVRRLAEQGQSAAEIAEAIGSTPGSVRVKCCRLKIRLRPARGR